LTVAAARRSSEAERYLIAAMLTNQGIRHNLLAEMTPSDFWHEDLRRIFIAVSELDQDTPSLSGWINARDLDLEEVDQKQAARLMSEEPSTARWKKARDKVQNAARIRDLAVNVESWQQELQATEDVDALTSRALSTLEGVLSSGVQDGAMPVSTATSAVRARIQAIRENQGIVGLRTGFGHLDRKVGGLQKDRNTILAARSGHGKTTFSTTVVKNVLMANDPDTRVMVQSTEMTREQYVELLARAHAHLSDREIETGDINDHKMRRFDDALEMCDGLNLWVDDFAGATPDTLRRNILRVKPDLVVIDYLQRMKLPRDLRGRSEYEDLSTLSLEVDRYKSTYRTSLLTVVQLSRKSEDRDDPKPRMSDIRGSGQIEQDGNLILGLYRPSKYKVDAPSNLALLDCLKNRHGDEDWGIKLYKTGGIPYLTDDPGLGAGYGGHPESL
jgi:replicative DNA helicase